jgi:predicted transcriptional regulator
MADKRSIMRIQLDTAAKEDLDKICSKRGMTQIAVMSRLVGWFIRQDDVIQTAVMATLSDQAMGQLASQLLKRMSSRSGKTK